MKKALMIASMASMLDNFNRDNIELLHQMGYEITLAANFQSEDSNSQEKVQRFRQNMEEKGFRIVHVDFTRKISNGKGQARSFGQVKRLAEESYDLVHCHSPICAAMTRIAFRKKRKKGTKVMYTAHGFHFYEGAPLQNWLMFFPAEWLCAHFTDVLLTINTEDYKRAAKYFKAKNVEYLPGVGVDTEKFQYKSTGNRKKKRRELGLKESDILLLSVGELNRNKNHEIVMRAIADLQNDRIHYAVAGQGGLCTYLGSLAEELKIAGQVHLLGFQEDVASLYQSADLYLLPSKREGLNVSLLEAMSSGLPCIVSRIRGNVDLVVEGEGGFLCTPDLKEEYMTAIEKCLGNDRLREKMGEFNRKKIEHFDRRAIKKEMKRIYRSILNEHSNTHYDFK